MGLVALGVDVAARRGCDVVVLDDDLLARPLGRVRTSAELRSVLAPFASDVPVGIDAPPRWAQPGTPRSCERALRAYGLSVFQTPDAARGATNAFYDWMRTGFEMFEGAAPRPALETFPHATAVACLGHPPERGLLRDPAAKRAFRRGALDAAGVDHRLLRTIDEVDAALCALTARRFREGRFVALGDPDDDVIVVPEGLPAPRTPSSRGSGPGARGTRATA